MTDLDKILLVLAILQAIAIAAMVWVGVSFAGTFKRARKTADPALQEAKGIAAAGKSLGLRVKSEGMASAKRARTVLAVVKRRADTTLRIAREIKPHVEETAAHAREARQKAAHTAQSVSGLASSLGRLKHAAKSAARAARSE